MEASRAREHGPTQDIIKRLLEHSKGSHPPYSFLRTRFRKGVVGFGLVLLAIAIVFKGVAMYREEHLWNSLALLASFALVLVCCFIIFLFAYDAFSYNIRPPIVIYLEDFRIQIEEDRKLVNELSKFEAQALEDVLRYLAFDKEQVQSRVTALGGDKIGFVALAVALTPLVSRDWVLYSLPGLLVSTAGAAWIASFIVLCAVVIRIDKALFLCQLAEEQAIAQKK